MIERRTALTDMIIRQGNEAKQGDNDGTSNHLDGFPDDPNLTEQDPEYGCNNEFCISFCISY